MDSGSTSCSERHTVGKKALTVILKELQRTEASAPVFQRRCHSKKINQMEPASELITLTWYPARSTEHTSTVCVLSCNYYFCKNKRNVSLRKRFVFFKTSPG